MLGCRNVGLVPKRGGKDRQSVAKQGGVVDQVAFVAADLVTTELLDDMADQFVVVIEKTVPF